MKQALHWMLLTVTIHDNKYMLISVCHFQINIDDSEVGKLTKIRLEHDNSNPDEPGWHVDKVSGIRHSLRSGVTGQKMLNQWFSARLQYLQC